MIFIRSFIKYPGGKEKELSIIRANLPTYSGRFIEPFVGGGSVYFDTENTDCYINDKSTELINLYLSLQSKDADFSIFLQQIYNEFQSIENIADKFSEDIMDLYNSKLSIENFLLKYNSLFTSIALEQNDIFQKELFKNLKSKLRRAHKLEAERGKLSDKDCIDNIESALKSAYYMYIRYLFNHSENFPKGKQSALFFFIREFCYSSMFRYNTSGEFNVPYGGISYNRKDFQKKIDYALSDKIYNKLLKTRIYNLDFEDFFNQVQPTKDDFIFLDPPYDSDFSTYANNPFDKNEQIRLRNCLLKTKAKFMLVIKNTDFILNLYKDDFNIKSFDKKYLVSFKNRNDKQVTHLLITNY